MMTESKVGRKEFSVYWYDPDDNQYEELRWVDAETAVNKAKALTTSIGGRLGMTRKVIITDGGDCCVFEWRYGPGVVWPKLG